MKTTYRISEISKLYNIGLDSLRYYEKIGLLSPNREENNYRTYSLDDIWKLNMIKDLRRLDFSMEEIKIYLENRTIQTTQNLLKKEIQWIDNKIKELNKTKTTLLKRQKEINNLLEDTKINLVIEKELPKRTSVIFEKQNIKEEEMDMMVKKLHSNTEKSKPQPLNTAIQNKLYILGDSILGATIHIDDYIDNITKKYSGVFMLIEEKNEGSNIIEAGLYLSYSYRGAYSNTWKALHAIKTYAKEKGYKLKGSALELWAIDIHETEIEKEYLTEVQVKVKRYEKSTVP